MKLPITKRVNDARSYKFPVNQEVTMNADGSGGPVSIAKKIGPQGLGVKGNNGYHIGSPSKKKGEKDQCYHKVRARYDVWPSAYASGALTRCRKVGAANWGNKSKKKK
jgi:hypothetical protein